MNGVSLEGMGVGVVIANIKAGGRARLTSVLASPLSLNCLVIDYPKGQSPGHQFRLSPRLPARKQGEGVDNCSCLVDTEYSFAVLIHRSY